MDVLQTQTRQVAQQIAGYLGSRHFQFTLGGQPVAPEQAVDAVMLQGKQIRGLSPDGKTNEYLANAERLRFFLARQGGIAGMDEAEIHPLVEGPSDDPQQLRNFELLAQSGVTYRTAQGNDIPRSPGMLPYLAERSGRNLQMFVPGASAGRPVQTAQQLQAALKVLGWGRDTGGPQRQENIQSLMDQGFHMKSGGRVSTAQDICLAQGTGETVHFSLPGSSVEHKLPICADWDAEGLVQLAQVRERGRELTQGDTPLSPGSVDMHHAQQIAGEYTETTMEGYLRTVAGTPDAASLEAARTALRGQIDLMNRRLTDLESQARKEALDSMSVQTQFLEDTLGSGSGWPFSPGSTTGR